MLYAKEVTQDPHGWDTQIVELTVENLPDIYRLHEEVGSAMELREGKIYLPAGANRYNLPFPYPAHVIYLKKGSKSFQHSGRSHAVDKLNYQPVKGSL